MGRVNAIRILLADDHAVVRAGIRKTLEELPGLQFLVEAEDGPQVFAALEQHAIDCLLIDANMPQFEPVAAIQQIRARFPDMKILVISAYDDDGYVQGLLAAGVHGYHLKDQPLNDLKLALQRVLAGERWLSSPLIDKLVGNASAGLAAPLLTGRQRDLLRLLAQGLDNQSIAREMAVSVKTVENHLTRLYRRLDVQSRLEAVHYAMQNPQMLGQPGQQAAASPAPAGPRAANHLSVLVVDDNQRYRVQLQRLLGKAWPQATLYEASDVETAVHLARHMKPALALIDVVLGDEDGIGCARRVKAVSPQSRVVLISAYPDREFHQLGLQAGAVAFLDKKDLGLATLRQVIEDLLK
jgi:DNA-binding NarL/FixJ family response regulator